MMRKIINKHWSVLQINPKLQETFQNNLFVAFKGNKNLQEHQCYTGTLSTLSVLQEP